MKQATIEKIFELFEAHVTVLFFIPDKFLKTGVFYFVPQILALFLNMKLFLIKKKTRTKGIIPVLSINIKKKTLFVKTSRLCISLVSGSDTVKCTVKEIYYTSLIYQLTCSWKTLVTRSTDAWWPYSTCESSRALNE